MLINLRRRKRAQSLVIVALSATALFGIIALGLDAGRLYFQRRDVQNAADAGALAGAQELIPDAATTTPTTGMIAAAGCQASVYALVQLQDIPQDGAGCSPLSPNYTPTSLGAGISEPARNLSATVQVWSPSRSNNNEIHVRVTYNVPLTFANFIGFRTSAVVADAYAHAGFYNKTYTVFGFDAGGSGNSVNYDQNGNAQIDDGFNGTGDYCLPSAVQGKMVSNAKWHAPNPGGGYLDLNGQFYHAQASDTHALTLYWASGVTVAQGIEPAPNYEAPARPTTPGTVTSAAPIGGTAVHVISPGLWTSNLNIPGSIGGAGDIYRFMNGVYYFQDASLNISGGIVGNTMDGRPVMGPYGGITDLPAASDKTNGVEFVLDGSATFNATSTRTAAPSVFFTAPSFVPSGTDSIVFFIKATDTVSGPNGTPWVEQIDGTLPSAGNYPFQIWGTLYNADLNGSHGTGVVIQAVNTGRYAITGEVVSPQVDLDGGNLGSGPAIVNTRGNPCNPATDRYTQPTAGYLVQFNSHYVPHFRGLAYLVK